MAIGTVDAEGVILSSFYKAEFDFRCTTVSCHAVLGMFQPGYIVASAFSVSIVLPRNGKGH